jgi:hypothetical protein
MAIGTAPGTGAEIKVPLEFEPRKVELFNVDGLVKAVWTDTMPAGAAMKEVTAGTKTYIVTGGVTRVTQQELDSGQDPGRGFTIGTDTDINASSEVIHWVAYE